MHCIYEVRYEVQWHSAAPSHWEQDTVKVYAGPDALEAVEKARADHDAKATEAERLRAALERLG